MKNMKYLGKHWTKYLKDVHTENYKTCPRKMKECQKRDILHLLEDSIFSLSLFFLQ
jgi:hypothetical protein